ncbi:MAG: DUF1566 domain-containing protein [Deltaproteobacteria bacterium]|nr:DUF1566 domain-containing protein [Deltaproteobacteria bacterium]
MGRTISALPVLAVCASGMLCALGCSDEAGVVTPRDAATAADAGATGRDAESADRSNTGADSGIAADANAVTDASVPDAQVAADASVAPDAEVAADASVAPDADLAADTSVAPDAEVAADASVAPDAQVDADASAAPDAAAPTDAGPSHRNHAQWPMPDSPTEYCSSGTAPIACPAPTDVAFGQDGNFRQPLAVYTTTADTVVDSITGLTWQRTGVGSNLNWSSAVAFCDNLTLGGFDDWRLPSSIELMSLADVGDQNAELNSAVFPGLGVNIFWSSTLYADYAANKWAVHLGAGYRENLSIGSQERALCVRGGTLHAGPRYTVSAEVVNDNFTGLSWQRGFSSPTLTWLSALDHCQALSLGGFSDWRLPSLKELNTLFDDERSSPAIDGSAFPGTPFADTDYFWSSSPHYYYDSAVWAVKYQFGTTHAFFTTGMFTDTGRARCVR